MKYNDRFNCPHCGREQGDVVGDYTVPGDIGEPCTDECEWCYKQFEVTEVSEGVFVVEKAGNKHA